MRGSPSTSSTRRATRISAQWDLRGHLPHADGGRQRGDGARRRPQLSQGGIEAEPQALRGLPPARRANITFVNKLDREGRDPFDLLDEIDQSLALDVTPASWPIGMGRDFLGTYDLFADALLLFERGVHDRVTESVRCNGLDDPQLPRLLLKRAFAKLRRGRRDCERGPADVVTSLFVSVNPSEADVAVSEGVSPQDTSTPSYCLRRSAAMPR